MAIKQSSLVGNDYLKMTIVTQILGKQGVPSASPPSFTLHLIFLHYGTHYYELLEAQYKSTP